MRTLAGAGGPGVADMAKGEGGITAIGWATVDLERTTADLPELHFDDSGDEPALGARALRARVGSIDLLLLEPSTDRRLAGWLARNDEGVAVLYVEGGVAAEGRHGTTTEPALRTALGRPGKLQVPDDRTRPFVIVLDLE